MLRYEPLIRQEERHIRHLHEEMHRAYQSRFGSKERERNWGRAAERFRTYSSELDEMMDSIFKAEKLIDPMLIEFSIDFLVLDPDFFRSGYMKSEILKKLKQTGLSKSERERLQKVLIDAVRKRGRREYRDYCKLASKICTPKTKSRIAALILDSDSYVSSRASMMYSYLK